MTEEHGSSRGGFFSFIKNFVADAIGATRARVDYFSADVEQRIYRLIAMLMWSVIAIVSLFLGLTLAVLTIIFGFDLPPKYAFGIPALLFLAVGAFAAFMFRFKKASKPKHAAKHDDR